MNKTVTIEELREKIDSFPRVRLAVLPTPLHEVPRFSAAIGGPRIFIKRDDLTPDVIAYVNCFCEIVEQCKEMGIKPTHLYLASYDSTQAGLELSITALGSSIRIVGIAPGVWESDASELIVRYANQAAEKLNLNCRIKREDVCNTTDYVGERYGIPTQAGIEMIKLMARTEGIFLDPVYTSKAMSALYDHVKKGKVTSKDVVIFLHTGGTPALFAYQEELGTEELRRHLVFD